MLGHIYHILYTEHHRRIRQANTAKKKDKLSKIEGQLKTKVSHIKFRRLETGDLCLQVTNRKETQA